MNPLSRIVLVGVHRKSADDYCILLHLLLVSYFLASRRLSTLLACSMAVKSIFYVTAGRFIRETCPCLPTRSKEGFMTRFIGLVIWKIDWVLSVSNFTRCVCFRFALRNGRFQWLVYVLPQEFTPIFSQETMQSVSFEASKMLKECLLLLLRGAKCSAAAMVGLQGLAVP